MADPNTNIPISDDYCYSNNFRPTIVPCDLSALLDPNRAKFAIQYYNTEGLLLELEKVHLAQHDISEVIGLYSMPSLQSELEKTVNRISDWMGALAYRSLVREVGEKTDDIDIVISSDFHDFSGKAYFSDNILKTISESWSVFRTDGIIKGYFNPNINKRLLEYYNLSAKLVGRNLVSIYDQLKFGKLSESHEHKDEFDEFILRVLVQVRESLKEIETNLKKKIKRLRRIFHTTFTLDIRYHIRTIIRSLRITPFDGKESDSVFSSMPITLGNYYSTLFNLKPWVINRNNYKLLNMPSL
jgi:hypothetical protein